MAGMCGLSMGVFGEHWRKREPRQLAEFAISILAARRNIGQAVGGVKRGMGDAACRLGGARGRGKPRPYRI